MVLLLSARACCICKSGPLSECLPISLQHFIKRHFSSIFLPVYIGTCFAAPEALEVVSCNKAITRLAYCRVLFIAPLPGPPVEVVSAIRIGIIETLPACLLGTKPLFIRYPCFLILPCKGLAEGIVLIEGMEDGSAIKSIRVIVTIPPRN